MLDYMELVSKIMSVILAEINKMKNLNLNHNILTNLSIYVSIIELQKQAS